jgi:hypothetical protein
LITGAIFTRSAWWLLLGAHDHDAAAEAHGPDREPRIVISRHDAAPANGIV